MTDTITPRRTAAGRPVSGRSTFPIRWVQSIWYDVRLVIVGAQTMADAVLGEHRTEPERQKQLKAGDEVVPVRPGVVFGHGVVTAVLGVVSWFLVLLLGMAVVRGVFYGVVTDGPYGAGTWGGPTKAGAWAVHAAVSVPIIVGLMLAFRGIHRLHVASARRLYGPAGRWVLPATIAVGGAGMGLIWAWIQQL
ncbi:hypothetical protein AB0H36_38085 [Kribbella sp. NPDC050820]|uniref:hypothetical protein n=1 Tax=Kribbella sp. NPDC050820 TaxID=3155408 RepID=UPI0033ECF480